MNMPIPKMIFKPVEIIKLPLNLTNNILTPTKMPTHNPKNIITTKTDNTLFKNVTVFL